MENQNIKDVLLKLVSKWYYFAIALVICVGLALFYISTKQKEYQVLATLRLSEQTNGGAGQGKQFLSGVELLDQHDALQDEIGVLTSFSTFRQAVLALDFTVSYFSYENQWGELGKVWAKELYPPPFRVALDYSAPQLTNIPINFSFSDSTYRVWGEAEEGHAHEFGSGESSYLSDISFDETRSLSDTLTLPFLRFSLTDLPEGGLPDKNDYYVVIRDVKSLTESYLGRVEVTPIAKNSTIVELSMVGPTVDKEERFLNTLSTVYIENDRQKKSQLGMNTIRFIDQQLDNVSDTLKKVEQSLEEFRNDSRIVNIATTSENLTSELNQLERERAQLNVQNEYYRHIATYLRNNRDVSDIAAPSAVGINDRALSDLLVELSSLYRERNEKQQSTSTLNPIYQLLERKIRGTKAALEENVSQLVASSAIALRENQRNIGRINQVINRLPENENALTNINRQFSFNDNIYNYLLQKRTEAGIAVASYVPDKNVIDGARKVGGVVSPNKMVIMLLALMVGFGLPATIIVTQDYFNDRIRGRKQLVQLYKYPLVSVISRGPKGSSLPVVEHPMSSIAEAFKYTQTNLGYFFREASVKVVGVTSSVEGEGKSFCSENLAATYAMAQQKTLLLSFDLRKKPHQRTFPKGKHGVADYVMGHASLSDIIQTTDISNLHVIPPQDLPFNAARVLEDQRMADLFSTLRETYDKIVVDTPPFNYVSDFLLLQPFFDVSLFVVRHNYTKLSTLEQAVDLLRTNQVDPVSFMYNMAPAEKEYGYGYQRPSKKLFSLTGRRQRKQSAPTYSPN
jgi:capsular exopolysaccharide synthesis family protein